MNFPLPGANWTYLHTLTLKATTGAAGFALVNGTPDLVTWTAPDDGQLHRVTVYSSQLIGSSQTGGTVSVQATVPGAGSAHFSQVFPGGSGASAAGLIGTPYTAVVGPGSTVTVSQTSALTGGDGTVWAEIWAL